MNAAGVETTRSVGGKEEVSFDQKPVQRTGFGGHWGGGEGIGKVRLGEFGVFSPAPVCDRFPENLGGHGRVLVGEVEGAAGDFDSDRLVAVQGKEPDTGIAQIIVDVCADVEFMEP